MSGKIYGCSDNDFGLGHLNQLRTSQKEALRPFLRCLGILQSTGTLVVQPNRKAELLDEDFLKLHEEFRKCLLFSDVYGSKR